MRHGNQHQSHRFNKAHETYNRRGIQYQLQQFNEPLETKIVMKSKTNQNDSTNLGTPSIAIGSNTNNGNSTRSGTPSIVVGSNTNIKGSTISGSSPVAMGSNSTPNLVPPRPTSPHPTADEERLNYFRLPAAYCSCKRNSVVCHHRSAIYTTAIIRELNYGDEAGARYVPHSFVLNKPPPQPETYTTHLAILRNPKHQEQKSQPHKYLSPALSNTSPHYVKRFVETSARADLKQGIYPGRPDFTLSTVQSLELTKIQDEIAKYKTVQEHRLEREKRKQDQEMIGRKRFEQTRKEREKRKQDQEIIGLKRFEQARKERDRRKNKLSSRRENGNTK